MWISQLRMLEQQMFISHSSRSWKSKIKVPADSVPGENLLSGFHMTASSLFSEGKGRETETALVFLPLLRTLILPWEPPHHNLI